MRLDSNNIKYPIATITTDWILTFARSSKDLYHCNRKMIKSGYFNGLKIVDSIGSYYVVDYAIKKGHVGMFWGYDIFFEQKIYVDLIFSNLNEYISLSNFKNLLLEVLKYHSDFWDSDGKLRERRFFIQEANSYEEIIASLTKDYYKEY